MKKFFAVCAVLGLMSSAAFAENVVRMGVFEPMTGDSGPAGKQETVGIQYANHVYPTVKIGGEDYKVVLYYADIASSTDKAPSAALQLVNQNVSVAFGAAASGLSIAGSQTFGDAGIPIIGASCTNPQVTAGNTHYFRICFLDPFQGVVLANYAYKTLGKRIVYCLGELGNDYDIGLIHYFQEAFEALGGQVITDTFPTGNSDFTSYFNNATSYGAEIFFCPVALVYGAQIISQAGSMNVPFPILGSDILDSNVVTEPAKGTDLEIYVTAFYQEGGNPDFDNGFKAFVNSSPEYLANNGGNDLVPGVATVGYDAYCAAIKAIEIADSADPAKINEALWKVNFDGVTGHIEFDEIGDAKRNSAFIKKVNTTTGEWEFVTLQRVD